jgi:uncharacterized protein (DUF1499 family)
LALFVTRTLASLVLVAAALTARAELPPCPDSPNCVSSMTAEDDSHYIAPIKASDSLGESREQLVAVLRSLPRVEFQGERSRLNAEFTSLIFRFTDDVDFFIQEDGLIHVRSASRVGHWDLGANRRRVEELREKLAR